MKISEELQNKLDRLQPTEVLWQNSIYIEYFPDGYVYIAYLIKDIEVDNDQAKERIIEAINQIKYTGVYYQSVYRLSTKVNNAHYYIDDFSLEGHNIRLCILDIKSDEGTERIYSTILLRFIFKSSNSQGVSKTLCTRSED